MASPTQRSIHSVSSSSSSSSSLSRPGSSNPSPTTPTAPNPRLHRPRRHRHRRPPRHTATAPAAIHGADSPPNYTNQPFQPEQQTSHHHVPSSTSPLLTRTPRPVGGVVGPTSGIAGFYGISGLNLSNTSLDSNALLDHREQQYMRPRRSSTVQGGTAGGVPLAFGTRRFPGIGFGDERGQTQDFDSPGAARDRDRQERDPRVFVTTPGGTISAGKPKSRGGLRQRRSPQQGTESEESYDSGEGDGETTRLLRGDRLRSGLTRNITDGRSIMDIPRAGGTGSQGRDSHLLGASMGGMNYGSVNFPPSVPTSPRMEPSMYLDGTNPMGDRIPPIQRSEGVMIDIEGVGGAGVGPSSTTTTPPEGSSLGRQPTLRAEEDVCFPIDECLSDSIHSQSHPGIHHDPRTGRRALREWPDLSVLEEWSREEKEQRSEGIRAKKMSEPVYVGGRLRPNLRTNLWHREEEEAPYRFTYFNDELPATIHAHTISELLAPGQSFADLFRPEPRKYDDEEWEEDGADGHRAGQSEMPITSSLAGTIHNGNNNHNHRSGQGSPSHEPETEVGARPTFWLDVLSPTDAEMKTLTKAFGIHPLTAEDIMMQEAREKVELFRSYYLVSYKSFEQDMGSEDYLDPVNIYVVVFREGVISFHFSLTPHPANVRRRIRQLKDYITVSADWISYALIDDITDAFAPLIQSIEDEVDDIDERILQLHVAPENDEKNKQGIISSAISHKEKEEESGGNMLKRVGDCRKKVMGLYRLLGNKADVIKGFAKRCNEQWEVAPRSEIGLYLGDIQDHIVTMVSNLNHYEKILSRSHSNYLAQINIQMNQRQEQTADVLGRLTVLGTIVLPMNIITGLWGMNVLVPGQDQDTLTWFMGITGGLLVFGMVCYFVAKRVYGIV